MIGLACDLTKENWTVAARILCAMITSPRCARATEGCRVKRSHFRVGSSEHREVADRAPFAKYRDRLLEDIEHGRWQRAR